jgi:hypothetical protein
LKGYSAFSSFRGTFADIAWPEDVVFLESTLDGRPVSVRTLAAQFAPVPAAARAGPAARADDPPIDALADAERIARESKIRQTTKDHQQIARFRDALSQLLTATVAELTLTDSQCERFLKTRFGSTRGVTDPDRISVTLFAQRKTSPESSIAHFIIMYTRFRECAFAVFGACAKLALEVLGNHVISALYPVTGDNMHSAALGLPAAIDIVNDALTKVGHSALLRL